MSSPDIALIPTAAPAERAAPVVSTERISSVDILRGVALLGILVIHVSDFGSPGSFFPTAAGKRSVITIRYHERFSADKTWRTNTRTSRIRLREPRRWSRRTGASLVNSKPEVKGEIQTGERQTF